MNKFLLIMSCSKTKKTNPELMRVIDRYDGIFFRVLKKNNPDFHNLDILILSGKYGLLQKHELIECYNQKMDYKRVEELKESIRIKFVEFVKDKTYEQIFVLLSKIYYSSIKDALENYQNQTLTNIFLLNRGTLGEKQRDLKKWLLEIQQPRISNCSKGKLDSYFAEA